LLELSQEGETMLTIHVLDIPRVTHGGRPLGFPYRKAEALFYYMAVMKQTNRGHLAALLWCDETDEVARKNLRQTLYILKKSLPYPVIKSMGKSTLVFEPEGPWTLDIDELFKNPETLADQYATEVFSGFFVKDAPLFNDWLAEKSGEILDRLMAGLEETFQAAYRDRRWSLCEKSAKAMISLDDYNETAYRYLIDIYGLQKKIYKMQKTYSHFKHHLVRELGVAPSPEVKQVFEDHMAQKRHEISGEDFFFGKETEIHRFRSIEEGHRKDPAKAVIYVCGSSGEGKTTLINQMLSLTDLPHVQTHCYEAEIRQAYRPWQSLFKGLMEGPQIPPLRQDQLQVLHTYFPGILSRYAAEENPPSLPGRENIDLIFLDIIENLLNQNPLWLVIDDAQWLDPRSLGLLSTVIHYGSPKIGILLGSRIPPDRLLRDSLRQPYFHRFDLEPLSHEETRAFIAAHPGRIHFSREEEGALYEASKGNLFLIHSGIMIKSSHPEMKIEAAVYQELLRTRLKSLGDLDRKILEGLSLFFDQPNIYMLCDLLAIDLMDFFEGVEALKRLQILKEQIVQNELKLSFSHHLIREEIYNQLSVGKKRILHLRIAGLYEEKLENQPRDRFYYPQLIYHFERSLEPSKALKYKILNLDTFFNYTHELYPLLKDGILEDLPSPPHQEDILGILGALEKELDTSRVSDDLAQVQLLRVLLLHMKGRYLIKEGQYARGNQCILALLEASNQLGSPDYYILGCRQMIYSGIQNHDLVKMDRYIRLGLQKAREADYRFDEAILIRLRGLYHLLSGQLDQAEKDLESSLAVIRNYPTHKYDLHTAAALNYLGEVARSRGNLDQAVVKFNEALALYRALNTSRGMAPILTNKALALYQSGRLTAARETIHEAARIFGESQTVWKKATALALEGHLEEILLGRPFSRKAFGEIHLLAQKIGNPEEIAFVENLAPTETVDYHQ
jgi:DNA-binding SARP family transcriptional activator/tetratricopeptide (TPR) repeat protein